MTGAILGGAEAGPAAKRGGTAAVPVRHRRRFPKRTHGKVYLTLPGGNFVCSGTVVGAPNESLVITAGHCTYGCEGLLCSPSRATNFNFVPAYKNGDKPFGEWPARAGGVRATEQYENNESLAYDVGAAVIAPRNGRKIAAGAGRRSRDRIQRAARAALPRLWLPGRGRLRRQPGALLLSLRLQRPDNNYDPPPIRISCDMTGGASGGGWVIGGGRIASVTSYGYGTQPSKLYGPYFGSAIANFYDSVKND